MSRKLLVTHVGRSGEVAGGMTQVVNSYLRFPFPNIRVDLITSRTGQRGPRSFITFARAALAVARLPRQSVVVAHLSQGGSFVREGSLLCLAKLTQKATIAQLHGSSFAAFAGGRAGLVRTVLKRADLVHSLSSETSATVLRLLPEADVVLVPNAVEPGRPAVKKKRIVFGGAVSKRKGVDVLLRVWQELEPHFTDWELLLAGPLQDDNLIDELPHRATLLGSIRHDQLIDLLATSELAVLPSRDEAMPMFILEAMANGCCVIATRVGGIPPLLKDGAGLLIEPGDTQTLSSALREAMQDDDLRRRSQTKALTAFSETYSADAIFPRLEAVWMSVAS